MFWRRIKKIFPFIGLALFAYLLIKLDLREIIRQVIQTDKLYLFVAFFMIIFLLLFQTLKWHVLARKQKILIPFKESFKINLMSDFYGLVTPGKLGTVMRAEYLKKYAEVGKGLSNFTIDKVLDLVSLFSLAILLGFFILREKLNLVIMNYLIVLFFVLIVIFLIFYNKKRSKSILRVIYKRVLPKRLKEKAKGAFESFYEDLPKKRHLIWIFLINFTTWVINYGIVYFIALSLGININFLYFIAIYPIATLVAQIPITISGLGTREATLIGLFGLFGITATKVFSMSLIGLFMMAIFPALIAIPLILKERKKDEIYKIGQGG
jgi:hypothetical protein